MRRVLETAVRRGREIEADLCGRWRVSRAVLALVALAVAVVAVASTALAAVSDDVLERDGLETHDAANLHLVTSHRTGWLVAAARYASFVGSVGLLLALAACVAWILWRRGVHVGVAIAPVTALLVSGLVAAIGKQLVARGRPPFGLRLVTETGKSFPSGHATDSAALFVSLGIVLAVVVFHRPIARVLSVAAGFATAAAIGLSRLLLGVHWPTDVVAGWAVGTSIAVALTTAMLLLVRTTPRARSDRMLARAATRARTVLLHTRRPRPATG
jgi:undecaprenyl-diphosphatase